MMLLEVLSEFSQRVLPLPCNICVIVTSERHPGDGVTASHVQSSNCSLTTTTTDRHCSLVINV